MKCNYEKLLMWKVLLWVENVFLNLDWITKENGGKCKIIVYFYQKIGLGKMTYKSSTKILNPI